MGNVSEAGLTIIAILVIAYIICAYQIKEGKESRRVGFALAAFLIAIFIGILLLVIDINLSFLGFAGIPFAFYLIANNKEKVTKTVSLVITIALVCFSIIGMII